VADRNTVTRAYIDALAARFRDEVGGACELVAAALERDHAHLVDDAQEPRP